MLTKLNQLMIDNLLKSTLPFMSDNLVTWRSKKQHVGSSAKT